MGKAREVVAGQRGRAAARCCPIVPSVASGGSRYLLLACAAVLALPLAAPAGRPREDMAQALGAQQPRRREGAGAPEPLFRNLRIMVHAEVPCLPLH